MKRAVLIGFAFAALAAAPSARCEDAPSAPAAAEPAPSAFAERMDFANGLYARDMYSMAVTEYDAVVRDFPSEPSVSVAHYRAAESTFLSRKYDEAAERYRAFVARWPETAEADLAKARIGEALYHSGRREEARAAFEPLVSGATPRAAETARYYLGKMLFEDGRTAEAERHLRVAAQPSPGNVWWPFANFYLGEIALSRGDTGAAAASYEAAAASGASEIRELAKFGLGRARFLERRYDEARRLFEEVYVSPGGSGLLEDAFVNYLNSLYALEEFETLAARAASAQAFVTSPAKRRQVAFLAADAYARLGRTAEARALYDEVASSPDVPPEERHKALLRRVESRVEAGDLQGAIDELEQLIAAEDMPKDTLLLLLSNVLARIGKPVEALSQLDRLIREYPESGSMAEAMLNKSYLLVELDKPKRARSVLRSFLARFPDHEMALKASYDLVLLDIRLDDKRQAVSDAEAFLTRYPEGEYAEKLGLRLGRLYTDVGDFGAARETYESYLEAFPRAGRDHEVYFLLGFNEQSAGACKGAVRFYDKVDLSAVTPDIAYSTLKNRAYCSIVLNDFDAAARDYSAVIARFPRNDLAPEAFFWLADHYLKKKDAGAAREAIENFAKREDAAAHRAELDYYAGETLRIEGRHAEAVASYTSAIDANAMFKADALLGRGLSRAASGDAAGAEADFNEALKEAAEDHEVAIRARRELANLLYARRQYAEAAKAYLAIGILYDDAEYVPDALMNAADSFERASDAENAQQVYRELIQRFGRHPLAAQAQAKLKKEGA